MGKCYDNPKYDRQRSDIQNTWDTNYECPKPKEKVEDKKDDNSKTYPIY